MRLSRTCLVVLLVILAAVLLRIHLIHTPLERDEGEYAYAGQLMLQGIPPYQLASNMKLPGTYAAYAVVMALFGQTIAGIHTGLLLVNAATILLVFLLGRRLYPERAAVAACAAYALLSVGAGVLGTQAHATHFVILSALGGLLLLFRYRDSARPWTLWWSGFLFGVGFLMKQHGMFFGLFGAGWLLFDRRWKKVPLFAAGAVAPFALTCLILWRAGVFSQFWFWTFTYAGKYVGESSLSDGAAALAETFRPILRENAALWILAGVGAIQVAHALLRAVSRLRTADADRRRPRTSVDTSVDTARKSACATFLATLDAEAKGGLLLAGFLVFSFAAVVPGLYFRAHYVVLMLPAVALLVGWSVRGRVSTALFAAAMLVSVVTQRDYLFRMSPTEISRELYGLDPFPEAIPISTYIRDHSKPNALIAVLGSEPEIYFYARRHSATSYLYTEPMVEPQPFALTMQNEMVRQLEQAAPEYVVRYPIEETLSLSPQSPTRIFDWWSEYGPRHYRLVAIADVLPDGPSIYRWDDEAANYQPKSLYHLEVYRRN